MKKINNKLNQRSKVLTLTLALSVLVLAMGIVGGCGAAADYTNKSLYPEEIQTIYVEMIQSRSFRRKVEYKVTDALCKQIEVSTPYKIVSDRDLAGSIISGNLNLSGGRIITLERETGNPLEQDVKITVVVNWKNLRTGELLIDNQEVSATATYSNWQSQGVEYGSALAANRVAKNIVELMEKQW